MAKALLGHVTTELHPTATLVAENRRLRRRLEDLETMVLRLQADNDRLAAAVRDGTIPVEMPVEDLQPA